jgi:hypothetical protein
MPNFYNIIRAKKFSTTADTALEIAPYNSANPNFAIDAGGKLKWGSGSATADTTLYRSTADVLKTDDSFDVASGQAYKVAGTDVLTSSAVLGSSTTASIGASTGNTTINNTLVLQQSKEKFTVSSAAINSTATNVDVLDGAVYYYTGTITTGFKFNIRGNSSTTLKSLLTTDTNAITVVLMIENVSSAKSFAASSYLTIDTSATVNIKWFGGSKPDGNIGTDVYTLTIYKTSDTGSGTFTVFASQSKFA